MNEKNLVVFCLVLLSFQEIRGDDLIQRILNRTVCITPRTITGCPKKYIPDEDIDGVHAYLFTRRNKLNPEPLHECGWYLPGNSYFGPRKRIQIIIHGFYDNICRAPWMTDIKDELLINEDFNVFLIDWNNRTTINIPDVTADMEMASKAVLRLIKNLQAQAGVTEDDIHIIGHSLGAHISGQVGNRTSIRRITGLDPAGPFFHNKPLSMKLDRSDAKFVDVIHSYAGNFPKYGSPDPLAHIDFYPNGGSNQPNCWSTIFSTFLNGAADRALAMAVIPGACAHSMSYRFFKASINNNKCPFLGVECSDYETFESGKCGSCKDNTNCAIMGFPAEKSFKITDDKPHKFYLDTQYSYPNCREPSFFTWMFKNF